jgi:hypothetical protein
MILFAGFFAGEERRSYALQAATCIFDTAAVLIGPAKPRRRQQVNRAP